MNSVAQISMAGLEPTEARILPAIDAGSILKGARPVTSSSLDLEVHDPTRNGRWDALLASHSKSSPFHSTAWARVLVETYGHRPMYLSFAKGDRTGGLLPLMEVNSLFTGRRAVSVPFSDSCDPLFFGDADMEAIRPALEELARDRKWKHVELRGDTSAPPSSSPTFFGHRLDLTLGSSELQAGCSSAVRRNLRKAQESDLSVQTSAQPEAVAQFYKLHLRTRRRHGAPPQPFRFFENIHRHVIQPGFGFVTLATHKARTVAAALFLTCGENAVYKFGASDERLQQYRANNLVMWEAIKYLCVNGVRTLHFGRTAPDNEGLRRFKLGWGAQEEGIHYRRLDSNTGAWKNVEPESTSFAQHVFRRLPSVVNRWAGATLYPHLD